MTTTRNLRQIKAQMAQLRASVAQVDQMLVSLQPAATTPSTPRSASDTDVSR